MHFSYVVRYTKEHPVNPVFPPHSHRFLPSPAPPIPTTHPPLNKGVRAVLSRARQRSRHSDGSALAWSWLTLSPRPVRVAVATPEDGRVGVYLTVLPAGNGSPPSHRPMYGCHMLSRVLAGEVEQVGMGAYPCLCHRDYQVCFFVALCRSPAPTPSSTSHHTPRCCWSSSSGLDSPNSSR